MKLPKRLQMYWKRLFIGAAPYPWEERAAIDLLHRVSQSVYACKLIADLLELEGEPGESLADYVSQALSEPFLERERNRLRAELAALTGETP